MHFFLILLLSSIGIDRIDLAGGNLEFRLTPYIALSIIFLAYFFSLFIFTKRGQRFERPELDYGALVLLLCISLLLSITQSGDAVLSRNRFFLLIFNLFSAYSVIKVISTRADAPLLFVRAAQLGIWIFFAFDIAQALHFYFGLVPPLGDAVIDIVPPMYGDVAIRPSGFAIDMNLGAFAIVTFFYWIGRYAQQGALKWFYQTVALTLLCLTLSRSGILAFVVMVGAACWYGQYQTSFFRLIKVVGLLTFVGTLILILCLYLFDLEKYAILFSERLSFSSDDSGGIHFDLIQKGLEVFLNHPLLGAGFGASYLDLVNFFEFDRYSNYHSLFITSLAETGLFGFIVLMAMLFLPLVNLAQARRCGPLLMALIAFNIFYLTIASPIFWIILAYAWIYCAKRN
jgi:O-Antigen ligase